MATIEQTYEIKAPAAAVWQALVDPKEIEAWGGGPAVMDGNKDTEFTLWGGSIRGKNVDVVPEEKLSQLWFSKGWEEASIATFRLSENDGVTRLELAHENVPDDEAKEIDAAGVTSISAPSKTTWKTADQDRYSALERCSTYDLVKSFAASS